MQVSNSVSFKALVGRKEIVREHGCNEKETVTIHLHPFKDEFKSQAEQDAALKNFEDSRYYKNQNVETKDGLIKRFNVIMEKALPFTKVEFLQAKCCPLPEISNPDALEFIASDKYATTVVKDTGFVLSEFVEDGNLVEG